MEHLPIIILLSLAVLGIIALRFYLRYKKTKPTQEIIQGEESEEASIKDSQKRRKTDDHFLWGNHYLNDEDASLSFLAVGSPGSGKTLNILILLRTVIERMNVEGSNVRGLIYDSKSDLYPKLRSLGLSDEQIVILNPFDERRVAWDIAKDITDPKQAEELAKILIPSGGGEKDPYFTNTARRLLAGVITAFQYKNKGEWTLRDLLLAARSEDSLFSVLQSCKYTKDLESHFKNEKTFESVRSTLDSNLDPLKTIAASWEHSSSSITINDWFDTQKMFVMGNDPDGEEPVKRINQLFFSFVSKRILGRDGGGRAKHWIILDELRELGKLNLLTKTMVTGRSQGASVVLGFQDLQGIFDEYGRTTAFEIIGCAQNVLLLKASPTATEQQEWQSKVAGSLRYKERKVSHTFSKEGEGSMNVSEQTQTDSYFIPSYFARIPKVSESSGLHGVGFVKDKLFSWEITGKHLWDELNGNPPNPRSIPIEDSSHSKIIPVPYKEQLLEPLSSEDMERLGIANKEQHKEEETEKPTLNTRDI